MLAPAAATPLDNGSTQTRRLCVANDQDWMQFSAEAGRLYTVAVTAADPAATFALALYADDGTTLQASTGSWAGSATLRYRAPTQATYALRIAAAELPEGVHAIPYTVTLSSALPTPTPTPVPCPDSFEPNDTPAAARPITVGTVQTHRFCVPGDVDWVRLEVVAATTYQLETRNLASGADTVLALYAADGTTLLAFNDDADGRASRLRVTAPPLGPYYGRVESFTYTSGPGVRYDLVLSTQPAPPSPTATSTATATATATPPPSTATATATPTPDPDTQQRVITYAYDGLSRLTAAVERGATTNAYAYGYDLAGNRTSATTNGVTTSFSFTAANQRTDLSYDAAGNLTSDGTTSYAYDALGRLVTQGTTTNAYTGDGVLVQRGTTRYAVDTVAGLSQILSDGTSDYLYGSGRLASRSGGTRVWHLSDALGSVRATLDDSGAMLGSTSYDPWGQVQSGTVPTFGFTGELQTDGLVHLRARWYNPGQGLFLSVDPWQGKPTRPGSLHKYAYTENDPVNHTDPSGLKRIRVWAAAFIAPPAIIFPYAFFHRGLPRLDPFAIWSGDDRDFANRIDDPGTPNPPSSRFFHRIMVDASSNPTFQPIQESDTAVTTVTWQYSDPVPIAFFTGTDTAKASAPPPARIIQDQCEISITINTDSPNPLTPSPPIKLKLHVKIDLTMGTMWVTGTHTVYPWIEIVIDGVRPHPIRVVQNRPDGVTGTPADLFYGTPRRNHFAQFYAILP